MTFSIDNPGGCNNPLRKILYSNQRGTEKRVGLSLIAKPMVYGQTHFGRGYEGISLINFHVIIFDNLIQV